MKSLKKNHLSLADTVCWVIIAISFILGGIFYVHFPEHVVTHWSFGGRPNGYSSPGFAAFFIPCLELLLYLILLVLPKIDPKKAHYPDFVHSYSMLKIALVSFFSLVGIVIGVNGIGWPLNIDQILPLLVGALFVVLGKSIEHVKNNWFVGIRNPWTISSDTVWRKTHVLGSIVFQIAGLVLIASSLSAPAFKISTFVTVILAVILIPNIYSYVIYRREHK